MKADSLQSSSTPLRDPSFPTGFLGARLRFLTPYHLDSCLASLFLQVDKGSKGQGAASLVGIGVRSWGLHFHGLISKGHWTEARLMCQTWPSLPKPGKEEENLL